MEAARYVSGLDPVADGFAGTKYSAVVNLKHWGQAEFIIHQGAGAGTTLITVEACKDQAATQVLAIESYRTRTDSTGVQSEATATPDTGFTTTAGGDQILSIVVPAAKLARTNWTYCRVKAVEQVAGAIVGGILVRLTGGRYGGTQPSPLVLEAEGARQEAVTQEGQPAGGQAPPAA